MSYKTNFISFVNSLPYTNIKFVYKRSDQLYVRTSFRKLKCCGIEFFFAPGNSEPFYHIFRESHIKYLLKSYSVDQTTPVILYNIRIEKKHQGQTLEATVNDINHGNRITFGFHFIQIKQVKMLVHKTIYTADDPTRPFDFYRNESACNFVYDSNSVRKFSAFKQTKCLIVPTETLKTKFTDPCDLHLVHKLSIEMLDTGRRKPLLVGGMPIPMHSGMVSYKNINFASDVVYKMVDDYILKNESSLAPTLFFDDEHNHIVLFVDNDDLMRHIVLLHAKRMFKACYAQENPELATKYEQACLKKFILASQEVRSKMHMLA